MIFGAGGDLPALMQLASYLVRMPVILTNRAESVRIANHVVASLYAYADGVAAAGIDKVGG